MLAFVHIEKAAGTTLIHLLRRNYFLRYMDVRPLVRGSSGFLAARDLKIYFRINPFVSCIGGHAVRACSDLHDVVPTIKYITLLRDPVDRYLSQYRYWVGKLNKNITFEKFMEHRPAWNFQVKKIAGEENLEEAKRLISDRFLLVGTVERFDEFLVLLGKKLLPFEFDAAYQRKNIAKGDGEWIGAIMDKYESKIREHNELDVKLYQYINDEVLPSEIESYGDMFEEAVRRHMHSNRTSGVAKTKSHVDYLFRKFYCTPVAGLIRKINGLPADGSYGSF